LSSHLPVTGEKEAAYPNKRFHIFHGKKLR
jgi:hypothetical protein